MDKKPRFNIGQRGENNSQAKLTVSYVRQIRRSHLSIWELGKLYDVSHTCIWMIRQGHTWKYSK